MLIDVPVTIDFDAQTTGRQKNPITFTLRFDIDRPDDPIKYALHYPPREREAFYTDTAAVLIDLMPSKTLAKIERAARRYPADYCATRMRANACKTRPTNRPPPMDNLVSGPDMTAQTIIAGICWGLFLVAYVWVLGHAWRG